MPLVTQGTRGYQHPSLPAVTGNTNYSLTMRRSTTYRRPSKEIPTLLKSHKSTPGDTNTPVNTAETTYRRPSKEIPTLLMSHKSTPGDTNTPVNTAERLTLIQCQPYRLYRTYPLFSFRLTLHTEESLSSSQTAKVYQMLSFFV